MVLFIVGRGVVVVPDTVVYLGYVVFSVIDQVVSEKTHLRYLFYADRLFLVFVGYWIEGGI